MCVEFFGYMDISQSQYNRMYIPLYFFITPVRIPCAHLLSNYSGVGPMGVPFLFPFDELLVPIWN